jgi:hypothetical protein
MPDKRDAGASFFGPVWTRAVPDPDAWVLYLAIIPLLACALREYRSARAPMPPPEAKHGAGCGVISTNKGGHVRVDGGSP